MSGIRSRIIPFAEPEPERARTLWYVALALFVLAVGLGITWDKAWHARNAFEDFFSPPHLFIYVMTSLVALVVLAMVFHTPVRRAFGRGFKVAILPFPVPGALFILGAGICIIGFAGLVLDNIWHTSFGLDETRWSLPHAMLGTGMMVTALGFVVCRLALRDEFPLRWHTRLLLGVLLVWPSSTWLGPLVGNHTPITVQAISSIPALAAQESYQHTIRIYQTHNLNRTNPLLIPLGALWAGMALAMIRRLDRRWWMVLLLAFLGAVTSGSRGTIELLDQFGPGILSNFPEHWRTLPLLVTAAALLLVIQLDMPIRYAYPFAGLIFGAAVYSTWTTMNPNVQWGGALVLLVIAGFTALAGQRIGEIVYDVLENPRERNEVLFIVLVAGVAMPVFTGIIDLILRATTP